MKKKEIVPIPGTLYNVLLTALKIVKDPIAIFALQTIIHTGSYQNSKAYNFTSKYDYWKNPEMKRKQELVKQAKAVSIAPEGFSYGNIFSYGVTYHRIQVRFDYTKKYLRDVKRMSELRKPNLTITYNFGPGLNNTVKVGYPKLRAQGILPLRIEYHYSEDREEVKDWYRVLFNQEQPMYRRSIYHHDYMVLARYADANCLDFILDYKTDPVLQHGFTYTEIPNEKENN